MKSESESYNQYDKMYTSMKSTKKSFPRIRRVVFFTLSRNAHFLRGCSDEQKTRSENRLKTDWTKSILRLIVYRLLRTTFNLFVLYINTWEILDYLLMLLLPIPFTIMSQGGCILFFYC